MHKDQGTKEFRQHFGLPWQLKMPLPPWGKHQPHEKVNVRVGIEPEAMGGEGGEAEVEICLNRSSTLPWVLMDPSLHSFTVGSYFIYLSATVELKSVCNRRCPILLPWLQHQETMYMCECFLIISQQGSIPLYIRSSCVRRSLLTPGESTSSHKADLQNQTHGLKWLTAIKLYSKINQLISFIKKKHLKHRKEAQKNRKIVTHVFKTQA